MSTIEDVAIQVMSNMPEDRKKDRQLSPALVSILVKLVTSLVASYGPALVKLLVDRVKLNWCQKRTLKKSIRSACDDPVMYRNHGQEIYKATLDTLPALTPDQMRAMIQESGQNHV